MAAKRKTSRPKASEVVAGKTALEYAELDAREKSLREELRVVSAAKAEKLKLLTSGMNSEAPEANDDKKDDEKKDDKKESVCRTVTAKPSHIFPTAEVIKATGLNRGTVSVYLSELATAGRIRRIKKGQYQALPPSGFTVMNPARLDEPLTKPDRVLALLKSEPETMFTAPIISKRFGFSSKKDLNAVRNALSRLGRDGKIRKASHGKYQALPGR
jgi:hypothetical protein